MPASTARELGKTYRLYQRPHHRLLERFARGGRRYAQEVVALQGVSFDVERGSTLGVIGENGAGKSTLLQLLARTLRPSAGALAVEGRVSAILDLGAGFHPEFTGRENVFMAGAILGFSAAEMAARLEEIASFAEIGEFFDRPVKTYSSGMFVRLAFSVATSVDPDILVIDEFLSVGDQYFQKKCIDRMEGFRKAGKTIVFCSHHLYQVRMVCDQTLWLAGGRPQMLGETTRVVNAYESAIREKMDRQEAEAAAAAPPPPEAPREAPHLLKVSLEDGEGRPQSTFQTGRPLRIAISYGVPRPPTPVHLGVDIFRNDGVECFATATHVAGVVPPPESATVTFAMPRLQLMAGEYRASAHLLDESGIHVYEQWVRQFPFSVHHDIPAIGMVYLDHRWEMPGAAAATPEATPAPALSVVSWPDEPAPWTELCQEALTRHSSEPIERVLLGEGGSVGEVLERTRGEFVALVHPAVALGPGWSEGLIRAVETVSAGAAGPVTAHGSDGQRLEDVYQDVEAFLALASRQAARPQPPRPVAELDPSCFLVRRSLLAALPASTALRDVPAALRARGHSLLAVPSVLAHNFARNAAPEPHGPHGG